MTYSSPCTSTSNRSSGLNSTVSPTLTVRTWGPTATASAQVRRRLICAVAGIKMPARERRSPSVCEICTMTRSKSTVMGCLSSVFSPAPGRRTSCCAGLAALSSFSAFSGFSAASSFSAFVALARLDPFFVVDVGT